MKELYSNTGCFFFNNLYTLLFMWKPLLTRSTGNSPLRSWCIWTRWWIHHTSSQACIMDPCVRVWLGGVSWGALCVSWPLWGLVSCGSVCVGGGLCSCWDPQVHMPSITRCGHYTQAGVEVDNVTARASTAHGSSIWLAGGDQGDSGLPDCVTNNVTGAHLHPQAHTWAQTAVQNQACVGWSKVLKGGICKIQPVFQFKAVDTLTNLIKVMGRCEAQNADVLHRRDRNWNERANQLAMAYLFLQYFMLPREATVSHVGLQ